MVARGQLSFGRPDLPARQPPARGEARASAREAATGARNFRLFGPDETTSNRLDAVFETTARTWLDEILPDDEHLAPDGRVMEILSEHACQGWLEGYLLTGRHGFFSCYGVRSVRMHWGRVHQADEIHELLIEEDVVGFRPAQRADHLILGYEQRVGRHMTARVEAFDKRQTAPRPRFENQFDTLAVLPELSVDRTRIVPDGGEFRGVEASATYEKAPWSYWASVVWAEAFDQFAGDDVPRSWDQRWKLSAGVDWQRGRWFLSSALDVHTGWATTFLFDPGDGAFQLGPRNEERLPTYASLDIRAEYRRPLRVGELRLALEITNLTNRENICCTQLRMEPDGIVTTQSRNWLPVIPSLSVRWDF